MCAKWHTWLAVTGLRSRSRFRSKFNYGLVVLAIIVCAVVIPARSENHVVAFPFVRVGWWFDTNPTQPRTELSQMPFGFGIKQIFINQPSPISYMRGAHSVRPVLNVQPQEGIGPAKVTEVELVPWPCTVNVISRRASKLIFGGLGDIASVKVSNYVSSGGSAAVCRNTPKSPRSVCFWLRTIGKSLTIDLTESYKCSLDGLKGFSIDLVRFDHLGKLSTIYICDHCCPVRSRRESVG